MKFLKLLLGTSSFSFASDKRTQLVSGQTSEKLFLMQIQDSFYILLIFLRCLFRLTTIMMMKLCSCRKKQIIKIINYNFALLCVSHVVLFTLKMLLIEYKKYTNLFI